MGLGKTLQTLAHVCLEKEQGRLTSPALVVAPTSLVHNWIAEAGRFAPGLRSLQLHGTERRRDFERIAESDLVVTSFALLARLASLIDKLVVYPAAMQKNLDKLGGLIHSQRLMIALTQKGLPREDAYALVQRNAMKVWGGESDFLSLLKADKDVRAKLSEKEIEALTHFIKNPDSNPEHAIILALVIFFAFTTRAMCWQAGVSARHGR
jgi:hypothetical protein